MKPQNPSPDLELLKRNLIDFGNINSFEYHPLSQVNSNWKTCFLYPLDRLLRSHNFAISKLKFVQETERINWYDWPAKAKTMVGLKRLDNIEFCLRSILENKVEGDLIETGVWRGGATILMRAILKEFGCTDRKVWLADSFQGLPHPDTHAYVADKGNKLHRFKILTATEEEVKSNFQEYGLLDEQVIFLKGWFRDTLPTVPVEQFALLRLDGDLYESTFLALKHLYPKLSPGGFVIVDDYHAFAYCQQAVDDYRQANNIQEKVVSIDKEAVYWQKTKQRS